MLLISFAELYYSNIVALMTTSTSKSRFGFASMSTSCLLRQFDQLGNTDGHAVKLKFDVNSM